MITMATTQDPRSPVAGRKPVFEDDGRAGSYVTDGRHLYRLLGVVWRGARQMIGVEDCRSLDVVLVPDDDLRAWALRPVVPSSR